MRLDSAEIARYLAHRGLEFELFDHPPASSSEEAFAARYFATGRQITGAKALVLRFRHREGSALALAVLRGHDRLSAPRLRAALRVRYQGRVAASFASPAELDAELRGLGPGRVPPLGPPLLPAIECVVVDSRLLREVEVGFNAAEFGRSIAMRVADFERALPPSAMITDIADSDEPSGSGVRARPQFHLAIPATDLESTEKFYGALGAKTGRHNRVALTLDFFGHQLVAHLVDEVDQQVTIYPRHFGVIVAMPDLDLIENRLKLTGANTSRKTRFVGSAIEHDTLLVRDPSGNQLEFKSYLSPDAALAPTDDSRIGDT